MGAQEQCCIGCCLATILVVSIIVVLICVKSVEPTEYGVVYNSISQKVDVDDVRTNGIYWLGLLNSFQLYPATVLTMEFSDGTAADQSPLSVKDSNGLSISLSISLQYQLEKENIGYIWQSYKFDYEQYFVTQINNAATELFGTGKYSYSDMWTDRQTLSYDLQVAIDEGLQEKYARCINLQLLDISLPTSTESSIVTTAVTTQETETKTYQQNATNTRAEMNVTTAECQKQVTLYQGYATANASLITGDATSYYESLVLTTQGDAYKQAYQNLSLSSTTEMLDYIYFTNMITTDQTVLVGIDSVMVTS